MSEITERLESWPFQTRQVCRLLNLKDRQVRHWTDEELVIPDIKPSQGRHGARRIYSYRNLIEFGIIKRLVDRGFSLFKVKNVLSKVREKGYFKNKKNMHILIYDDGTLELLTNEDSQRKFQKLFKASARQYLEDFTPSLQLTLKLLEKRMREKGESTKALLEVIRLWEPLQDETWEEMTKDPKLHLAGTTAKLGMFDWVNKKVFTDQGVYVLPVHEIEEDIRRRA